MKNSLLKMTDLSSVKPYALDGIKMTEESMIQFASCLSIVRGPFKRFCAASGRTIEETKEFNLGRFYSWSIKRERKEHIRQDNKNLVATRLETYRQQADTMNKKTLQGTQTPMNPITDDESVENEQLVETSKVVEFARLIGIFAG